MRPKNDEAPQNPPDPGDGSGASQSWPIGFIVLLVAAAAYLLLRFIQMAGWLFDWIG